MGLTQLRLEKLQTKPKAHVLPSCDALSTSLTSQEILPAGLVHRGTGLCELGARLVLPAGHMQQLSGNAMFKHLDTSRPGWHHFSCMSWTMSALVCLATGGLEIYSNTASPIALTQCPSMVCPMMRRRSGVVISGVNGGHGMPAAAHSSISWRARTHFKSGS